MANKRNSDPDRDEPLTGVGDDDRIRGVASDEDDEFDAAEDLDDEADEEDEESSTF